MNQNMPFTSKSQVRFLFAKHSKIAKEFAAKTASISALPEKVKKLPAKPKLSKWKHTR